MLRKLSSDFQTLVRASNKITSYKRAVEELIYNSLDADSTSIAIRISIEENIIQVIDNGCGVRKNDFALLGQKHTTSKCVDMTALKSAPNKYGFRGQSLANMIEVSQSVKITSKHDDSNGTWVKTFYKGKEQEIVVSKQRPSKGTTVEIKGFLYNLNIQKKSINALSEMNDIKHFLEQLSLVHSNASFSLRDDTKNEIVFKIHKNRDIYQTLSSIYGINKTDLQELKVEKNQYKVTAFIAKRDKDINQKNLVFLNGKILQNGKLQSIINDNLSKSLKLRFQNNRNVKSKNGFNNDDNELPNAKIPFYLVFVSCPYYDYDVSYTPKQSVLEFKNWDQISKLLEKLAKFYVGDVNLKRFKEPVLKPVIDNDKQNAIRDQVKKIMEKILGSNSKRPAVSQMQNGIKGKLAKRKFKRKGSKISLSKIIPPQKLASVLHNNVNDSQVNDSCDGHRVDNLKHQSIEIPNKVTINKNVKDTQPKEKSKLRTVNKIIRDNGKARPDKSKNKKEINSLQNMKNALIKKDRNHLHQKSSNNAGVKEKNMKNKIISSKKPQHVHEKHHTNKKVKNNMLKDPLISRFEKESASIKQRCNILHKKVENFLSFKKKRKRKIFVNETVQYSNIIKENKNVSIRKKIGEIVIHDYVPLPPEYSPCSFDNRKWNDLKKKPCKSSYDLVKTILKTQHTIDYFKENVTPERISTPIGSNTLSLLNYSPQYPNEIDRCPDAPVLPRLTYDSHSNRCYHSNLRETTKKYQNKKMHFITTQSKDNFAVANVIDIEHIKPYEKKSIFDFQYRKDLEQQPLSIDFSTRSKDYFIQNCSVSLEKTNKESILNDKEYSDHHLTYTIKEQNCHVIHKLFKHFGETYTLDAFDTITNNYGRQNHASSQQNLNIYSSDEIHTIPSNTLHQCRKLVATGGKQDNDTINNVNVVFVSESQDFLKQETSERNVEPLEVCETVFSRDVEIMERSTRERNDSLFKDEFYLNSSLLDRDAYLSAPRSSCEGNFNSIENTSRHCNVNQTLNKVITACGKVQNINIENSINPLQIDHTNKLDEENFDIRNRLRFVPKGMSPIFENCQTRNVCDYNLEKDYFEKVDNIYYCKTGYSNYPILIEVLLKDIGIGIKLTIYDDFVNNVQVNSEILQPGVQTVKDLTTRDIQKVNHKLKKDNASLIFDGDSLKNAMVLGQVDEKFIAANIKSRCDQSLDISEYLVLFDQHAVHERIRLENNLADYLIEEQWKSITLDGFILKLSKEDILYLHNYKDKFSQFGLNWTILNDGEISVNAIPEAVVGKNPRQVEVVMKAVKNLIFEEINTIKMQKGCVSLYPKSIMDLLFSEACRYAIKFGDKLSKNKCVELLNQLSECKTPFQCAHGRPVMAVIMELKKDRRPYTIDISKLSKFSLPAPK